MIRLASSAEEGSTLTEMIPSNPPGKTNGYTRRAFLAVPALGVLAGFSSSQTSGSLDDFIERKMRTDKIPGVAVGLIRNDRLEWTKGYGWADIEKKIPMGSQRLQNIGSISKTFTTTALMQLWEKGKFDLDDDVGRFVSFKVRHPADPDAPITFRQLVTHKSSIGDGPAYGREYACGDPRMSLERWLRGYLTPGGEFYDPQNFHEWGPGEKWEYCNVAYGLVAHLVESMASIPFAAYCSQNIFQPLGMTETSWYLRDIDVSKHSVPYTYVENGVARGPSWGGTAQGVVGKRPDSSGKYPDGFQPNCLYNHPNFPDGFLRTSLEQLSVYIRAYLKGGRHGGFQLLKTETVKKMLEPQFQEGKRLQGLTWYAQKDRGDEIAWGHSGSDPGINTDVRFLPSRGIGVIAFTNTNGIQPIEIAYRLLDEAEKW
jgi:CubicO group peptidase (beta-lactamase class C family)